MTTRVLPPTEFGTFVSDDPHTIKLFSYNLLSFHFTVDKDTNSLRTDAYGHYNAEHMHWHEAGRSKMMRQWLEKVNADIYCLQEVDKDIFETELVPFFEERGLEGVLHIMMLGFTGLAIFFRKDKFRVARPLNGRSRAMILVLEMLSTGELLFLVNCHLQGHPKATKDRFTQVQSVVREVKKYTLSSSASGNKQKKKKKDIADVSEHPQEALTPAPTSIDKQHVFFVGDFNSEPNDGIQKFLRLGELKACDTDAEFGQVYTEKDVTTEYRFDSAYNKKRITSQGEPVSVSQPFEEYLDYSFHVNSMRDAVVDFLLFNTFTVQRVEAVLTPFENEEAKKAVHKGFLPQPGFPSDHLPIGAVFTLQTTK